MKKLHQTCIAVAAAAALGTGTAHARDQIRIVGSSTVYPFSSYVAEEFGATTEHSTPVVESTGSGGGMRLFCKGVGMDTPDITNASRQMKVSEYKTCQENGVKDITQAVVGFDGIVLAQNKANPTFKVTREELTLAVAAEVPKDGELVKNPYTNWNEINPDLPDREILILGPPTTSGTRDAFEELVMETASEEMTGYEGEYAKVRTDGPYVPSGENDNLIVQKLDQNKDAFGIFGFGFLEENTDKIEGAVIDGVKPKRDLISSGEYPVSRSLFFYIKNAHDGKVPGIGEYVELFMSEKMIGEYGYLKNLGLIPLPEERRAQVRESVAERKQLELSDLQ